MSAVPIQPLGAAHVDAAGLSPAASPAAFARLEVFGDLAAAEPAWRMLQAAPFCGPYQSFGWAEAWCATVGVAHRLSPCIVLAYDAADLPVALLPLVVDGQATIRIARFIGGKDSNANLGLFAHPRAWDRAALRALLVAAASRARIDAVALQNQPEAWEGVANPLLALGYQPGANLGRVGRLSSDPGKTVRTRLSKHARKLLRQKETRLGTLGAVTHRVAATDVEAAAVIDAYVRQKSARARSTGVGAPSSQQAQFLRRAAQGTANGPPSLELHALWCGDEIVATFGGTGHHGRFSGMILAIEDRPEIARCSPGELLLKAVLEDLSRRNFLAFDLGLGDARYKHTFCDTPEPMYDTFLGITMRGHVAAAGLAAAARLKRALKRSDRVRRGLRLIRVARERAGLNRR